MSELNVGDAVPELRVTPDKYLPHRYAGASGDFNPIHIDDEFAKAVGLPRNILHGLYSMGLVAKANAALAAGDPRALKRLSVQFRGMGMPESPARSNRWRATGWLSTPWPSRATPRSSRTPKRKLSCRSAG